MNWKTLVCIMAMIPFWASPAQSASLSHGGADGGGGDICQSRIEEIRNDISIWIQQDGPKDLDFSNVLSAVPSREQRLKIYNNSMQVQIALTRIHNQSLISCTDDRALVTYDGVEKTCVATRDPENPKILCYRGKEDHSYYHGGFMGLSADEQYLLVHHEFAVLASIEDNSGQDSNYPLSSQISKSLSTQVVKKLAVSPQEDDSEVAEVVLTRNMILIKDEKFMSDFPTNLRCAGFTIQGLNTLQPRFTDEDESENTVLSTSAAEGGRLLIEHGDGEQRFAVELSVEELKNLKAKRVKRIAGILIGGYWWSDGNHYRDAAVVCGL